MRLETINNDLARRFHAAKSVDDARRVFESVFHACVSQNDIRIFSILGNESLEKAMISGGCRRDLILRRSAGG